LFEQLGGEPALRRIIDRFVDRVFDDVMIGFFFQNASRERIKAKEYEFAARHLGADIPYTGKPLAEAHAAHPIMGGQFMRRTQILKETLEELGVPERIREHWLSHTEKLRGVITRDAGGHCDADAATERVALATKRRPEGS
jgi:hemoglobin